MRSARAAAALLALGVLLAPGGSQVARADDGPPGLPEVRQELAESTEEMVAAVAALRSAEGRLPAARAGLERARHALAVTRHQEQAAAATRDGAQRRVLEAERSAEAAAGSAAAGRRQLEQLARQTYEQGPMTAWLAVLGARTPLQAGNGLVMLGSVAEAQRSTVAELLAVADHSRQRVGSLARARDLLGAAHAEVERRLGARRQAEAAAATAALALEDLVGDRSAALASARAAVAQDTARYRELVAVGASLRARLRERAGVEQAAARAGASTRGLLTLPVDADVSSPYGMRVHPITGVYKLHSGTDFGAPCGTPIRAAADGEVLEVGFNRAYGHRTVVASGLVAGISLTTTYNHQSRIGVVPGQAVTRGQVIGWVGTTGYSTGCHLHFEVLVNGEFADPLGWL